MKKKLTDKEFRENIINGIKKGQDNLKKKLGIRAYKARLSEIGRKGGNAKKSITPQI